MASLITFAPGETIKSADVNSNFAALNGTTITVNDGGTLRIIQPYEGTTDPSTYTTVNEGDVWGDG